MIRHENRNYKIIENQIVHSYTHHSHVRGIGIDSILDIKYTSQGFIGQICARKAIAIFLYAVKNLES